VCDGYPAPRRASPSSPGALSTTSGSTRSSPKRSESPTFEPAVRQVNWRQERLPLYHHFVTTSVLRLFRHDHVNFWRDEVAQMSYGVDIVYEALLAIGAVHRASLLACQYENFEEASRVKVLGFQAYGNALRLLPHYLAQSGPSDIMAVLIVLMLLTYFEVVMDEPPTNPIANQTSVSKKIQKEHYSISGRRYSCFRDQRMCWPTVAFLV
jgi:hypothetical protein